MICGAHESVAGGLYRAFERATIDGCEAIQIFTKNSNMWREPSVTAEQIAAFKSARAGTACRAVLAHTSYLINLATDKDDIFKRSKDALVAEVERSSALGVDFVVLHPGAHLGVGEEKGITQVARALDEVAARTEGATARILLENTAGQGTCVGHVFEHLGSIFAQADSKDRLGVCFDTQHAFAAGYDLSTREGYESAVAKFEEHVGLGRLRAFHLNDSKKPLGSRVDRHEHLGEGILGLAAFWRLVNDPRFKDVPGVLETEPRNDETPFREEVALLRSLVGGDEPKPAPKFALELAPSPPPKKKKS